MHVCEDRQSGKKTIPTVIYLFVYSGERKFSAGLAPSPGSQELGCIRVLSTPIDRTESFFCTLPKFPKTKLLFSVIAFLLKRDFIKPAFFWAMCPHNNLQECS